MTGPWAGETVARATEQALGDLGQAWQSTSDTPLPYSPPPEDAFPPGPGRIVSEMLERL